MKKVILNSNVLQYVFLIFFKISIQDLTDPKLGSVCSHTLFMTLKLDLLKGNQINFSGMTEVQPKVRIINQHLLQLFMLEIDMVARLSN